MKFQDAVKKSIRNFMNGQVPPATEGLDSEGVFHTPEYFDQMEEDLLGETKEEESADADV